MRDNAETEEELMAEESSTYSTIASDEGDVDELNKMIANVEPADLQLISTWAKQSLFSRVKFLFNPAKDLAVGGNLYWLFVRENKDLLEGLKRRDGERQQYRSIYVSMLWSEATKRKANLIADGLSGRRSAVYTALHNQFIGKSAPLNTVYYYSY